MPPILFMSLVSFFFALLYTLLPFNVSLEAMVACSAIMEFFMGLVDTGKKYRVYLRYCSC